MSPIVLFVHQSSEMYGSDKVLLLLSEGLARTCRFAPVVVVPTYGPLVDALEKIGVEVHIGNVAKLSRSVFTVFGVFSLFRNTLAGFFDLDRIVAGREVAVVHSNTLAVLSGAAWSFLRRKKHVWHVHEIVLSPKVAGWFFPFLVRIFSDRVISNSEPTESWLLSMQPSLRTKSLVVFNGLPPVAEVRSDRVDAFRRDVSALPADCVITVAGRINRWKGQEIFLEAAAELARRGVAGFRLAIVGSPAPGLDDLLSYLKARSVALGLEKQCVFIDFVDDIWPVWFGSDIAVVPSIEPEPFGMVAIEAMAAGRPVVAAAHGGLLDIVVDGETGILFEPRSVSALANALERLVGDESFRKRLGREGAIRQRELFSVESQVEKTANIYEGLMP